MKARIPLPPYLPDQTANSGGLSTANNVYPKTDGYGPISGFTAVSGALGAAFLGGASFIATDAQSSLLVGTASGLKKFAGGSWTNLVTGMTVTDQWKFAQFGNYAIGVNGSVTKVVNLTTAVASNLTGAPNGKCIAVVGDFVVIGQGTGDLLGIFTSEEGNHTLWNVATTGATYQPMLEGGEVMGLIGGEYGVILQRRRIVRMSRTGDTTAPPNTVPFAYDVIASNIGCASKGSVAQYDNTVFWLSDAGFKMMAAGQSPIANIGSEKIDRTFISEVARDDWEGITSAVDPQSKVVIWCVPGGKLWIYNWELDRWTTATPNIEGVFSGFTTPTDLDTLAITYPNLDAMTISLDDPRWSGGNPRLYAVKDQTVGTFYGDRLEATLEFSFNEFVPGRNARIRAIRPVTDATEGHTITLDCRARLGDAVNLKTASVIRTSGIMPVRASGRYIRPKWTVAAGTEWNFAQALEFDLEAGGER